MKSIKSQGGFSLIEILMAILIAGIVAAIAIPTFNGQRTKSKNAAAQRAVEDGINAAMAYFTQGETFVGFTAAKLNENEKTLGSTSGTGTYPAADATAVRTLAITNYSGASTTVDATGVAFCTASQGDAVYCARTDGNSPTQFGWIKSTTAAPSVAEENAAALLNAGTAAAGEVSSRSTGTPVAGGYFNKWPAN